MASFTYVARESASGLEIRSSVDAATEQAAVAAQLNRNLLERISDCLDEEIETTLLGLTSIIGPILIVFLGVVVGGKVICMFLPIFKLPEIVNGH